MDGNTSRSHLKRPLPEDDDEPHRPPMYCSLSQTLTPQNPPFLGFSVLIFSIFSSFLVRFFYRQKRPRFPKGKKVKTDDTPEEVVPVDGADPRFAAKERSKRRNQITAELFIDQNNETLQDISAAEENYEVCRFPLLSRF